ncbi:asparagine synthase (glutamine-hydrolysing) [Algoriphagus faecimaris]|uniref:asparagine synthase (glutamine-hydrolyzing) n=1 Tax=Algoriphagus faecimaris TaxID=686796 RepID=A0A1G6PTR6_9BACT|nr:asparagine synthase (glutamine-hydrolyzing) [Algoriphagus faecimaris]SDC83612.1 asparagine synthase (glutamine-hydrolysing) [Algoriphagus faecimaris]
MCGINGIVGKFANKTDILQMCMLTKHRGPDFTNTYYEPAKIALGHNRLAILDLKPESNQPFQSPDGRYTLVFNGEIYNYIELKSSLKDYPFSTQSDTEVLLAAFIKWGKECLNQLNGMFSFAIWDSKDEVLFAARDRFGVKPFYYSFFKDSLVFSSEISPFFKIGISRTPNESIWAGYFVNGEYQKGKQTFWKGIYRLGPGEMLTYSRKEFKVEKWYDFIQRTTEAKANLPKDLKSYFKELLLDSTSLRFRADVPVGFNLSGGLDSSMLLSLIQNQFPDNSSIEAFTFYTGDDRYDELPYVKQLVEDYSFPLNPVLITADEIPELTYQESFKQQEPFGGIPTLAYSKVFQAARSKGIKVLLDGQGADEVWAGYDYYFNAVSTNIQGVKKSPYRLNVLNSEFAAIYQKTELEEPFGERLLNLQYRDLFSTKLARALRFSDRVSMRHSTELREPFLDYRIVESAFCLDENLKVQDGKQKWLFREIAGEFLNKSIRLAPKRPLQTPQREWLSSDLKDWVSEEVKELENMPWFEKKELRKELQRFFEGDIDSSFHIWQWVNTSVILKNQETT